ncbi:hypothetical protein GOZ94_11235 [Agrobacterium vitis]|uniref:hypothetical protein n=1 Tax=Agrobacterium vitis TaxID=373 RepID=UPI0012E7AA55|nr:hypothetical protein [Agrobacterium vitis]MVA19522.1 hypothetical protein [Agrobacterium vitis]
MNSMISSSLYATLSATRLCPVCTQAAMPTSDQQKDMQLVRYQCGAVFGVSDRLGSIVAQDPCPSASEIAAVRLTAKTDLAVAA